MTYKIKLINKSESVGNKNCNLLIYHYYYIKEIIKYLKNHYIGLFVLSHLGNHKIYTILFTY